MIRSGSIVSMAWLWLGISVLVWPSTTQAACMGDWDLSGHWVWVQDNGYTVTLDLSQTGDQIGGVADFRGPNGRSSRDPISQGSIHGGTFSLTIPWRFPGNLVGVYTGVVDAQGHIGGTTDDHNYPGARAGWSSSGIATCKVVSTTTPPSQAEEPEEAGEETRQTENSWLRPSSPTSPPCKRQT